MRLHGLRDKLSPRPAQHSAEAMNKGLSIRTAAVLALATTAVFALNNGRSVTPPLGWRSCACPLPLAARALAPLTSLPPSAGNLFGGNVNHRVIMDIMTGMVDKSRTVDGVPTSLLELGYSDVGLDGARALLRAPLCPGCATAPRARALTRTRTHAHWRRCPLCPLQTTGRPAAATARRATRTTLRRGSPLSTPTASRTLKT